MVYRWLPGDDLASRDLASRDLARGDVDPVAIAQGLASFAAALRAIDPAGGPPPGAHNFYRGVPLVDRSEATLGAIAELGDTVDQRGTRKIWEAALELAPWTGPGRWIHGDLLRPMSPGFPGRSGSTSAHWASLIHMRANVHHSLPLLPFFTG